jgi:DNA (cytosine-5)-methyltransferase 3A
MNVVSLFNGMNTGRQALENVGIKVDKYYSSEIKPYAIELTQYHFPDTIQVGDVTKWREWDIDWSSIDLILSGSPCQDLTSAGRRAGINGSKSSLFFVFVDILNYVKELNPKVLFLQENVASARKKDIGIMSRALGIYPVRINSSLVTAQLRDRYYWSNIRTREDGMFGDIITDIPQPKDRGIMFKDIVTGGRVERIKALTLLEHNEKAFGHKDKFSDKAQEYIKGREKFGVNLIYVDRDKALALLESESRVCSSQESIKKRASRQFINMVYQVNESKESNGQQPYAQNRVYDSQGKIPALTECMTNRMKCQVENGIVRTLNQVEMERLQGFPDGYTSMLSKSKAASLLGDGWTLPIIEHIFKHIER